MMTRLQVSHVTAPPPPPPAQVLTCTSVDEARVGDGAATNLSRSGVSGSMSTITSLQPFCVRYQKTNINKDLMPPGGDFM